MVDIKRVKLPGVGVLHTFVTGADAKVGVIAHRSGYSDLLTFSDAENTDRCEKTTLRLDEDEARALAELLGGTQVTESLHDLDHIPGLSIDWFEVDNDDYIAGKQLGELRDQGVRGVTVVAVVRGDSTSPAPSPGFVARTADTLIVAGTPENVVKAFAYYRKGEVVSVESTATGTIRIVGDAK